MKKQLALAGLAAGLAMTSCDSSGMTPKTETQISATAQKTLNEQDLVTQLSPEGKKAYLALDPEGKKLALQLANQTWPGKIVAPA